MNNQNQKHIAYLTYDGLTDSLGQSQIIPYIIGLSNNGYRITIVSAEKPEQYKKKQAHIKTLLSSNNIKWAPLKYTKKPPVVSTLIDIYKFKKRLKQLYRNDKYQIIHCRSYITSIVGLHLKKQLDVKFIFDMRGFWADERLDGNIWRLSNPIYKLVYQYFKRKERQFLELSDHVVSLTHSAVEAINHNLGIPLSEPRYSVIPCCADLNHFKNNNNSNETRKYWRNKLSISTNSFTLTYLGSLGTWYMTDEMVRFFKILVTKYRPDATFLVITHDKTETIYNSVSKHNIDHKHIVTTHADREQLPAILSVSDAAVSFIKPAFSKKASSPTKLAELLGMEIPVFSNAGIGDIEKYYEPMKQLLINRLDNETFTKAWDMFFNNLQVDKKILTTTAFRYFSLNLGVEKYSNIYRIL